MLWQICFILVLVRQLLIIQAYLLKIFICVIIIISFVPNKLSGMTNQLLILFSKYGCFRFVLFCFLLSLCGLSRTTEWLAESWLLRRDIRIIWEEGVGMFFFFWEGGYLESPWWVPMAQRALCMVLFYKKDSANSSAAVKLSAVAFFTKLRGCSLLTCSVLSSGKKKLKNKFTGMLS